MKTNITIKHDIYYHLTRVTISTFWCT